MHGRPILSYQGIPYARPPVGELRFARPQEADRWEGTLQADRQYKCPQVSVGGWVGGWVTMPKR